MNARLCESCHPDLRNEEWVWMKLTDIRYLGQDGRSTISRRCVVPPVVVLAVVVHPDIHAVLSICGFANVSDCTLIFNNEGFQSIADFGVLEDKDVILCSIRNERVKHLGNRMVVAGHVNIGVIQAKKLQALCYWVCDQQKHG
jgi:hypothetical protein